MVQQKTQSELEGAKATNLNKFNFLLTHNIFKRLFIALWLGFLYVLCVCLVMSSLSGSLFQEKLNNIAKQNSYNGSRFIKHDCISESAREGLESNQPVIKVLCLPIESNIQPAAYNINEIIDGYEDWQKAYEATIYRYSIAETSDKEKIKTDLQEKISSAEKIINEQKDKEAADEIDFIYANLDKDLATLNFLNKFGDNNNLLPQFAEIQ